ncbi:MAG: ATP phosphoribosyltransferase [Phycisphaerales bacterium]
MTSTNNHQRDTIQFAIPKGRMYEGITRLLADTGVAVTVTARGYRPAISLAGFEVKILKPQNIVEMLQAGTRDVGFAGADWVAELEADVVEVLDTKLDPVRLVAAAPRCILEDGRLPDRALVIAAEFERLTQLWIKRSKLNATYLRSFGATEVFPPEDADCIIDVAATGATLRANDLVIIDEVMQSSTRLYASRNAWNDDRKRSAIQDMALLLESVLSARTRVMLEVNVPAAQLEMVVEVLPCMREPTIAPLYGDGAFAVKAVVPRASLATLIPEIKSRGGTDLVISPIAQVVA